MLSLHSPLHLSVSVQASLLRIKITRVLFFNLPVGDDNLCFPMNVELALLYQYWVGSQWIFFDQLTIFF